MRSKQKVNLILNYPKLTSCLHFAVNQGHIPRQIQRVISATKTRVQLEQGEATGVSTRDGLVASPHTNTTVQALDAVARVNQVWHVKPVIISVCEIGVQVVVL